jgi:hypothetical protein
MSYSVLGHSYRVALGLSRLFRCSSPDRFLMRLLPSMYSRETRELGNKAKCDQVAHLSKRNAVEELRLLRHPHAEKTGAPAAFISRLTQSSPKNHSSCTPDLSLMDAQNITWSRVARTRLGDNYQRFYTGFTRFMSLTIREIPGHQFI